MDQVDQLFLGSCQREIFNFPEKKFSLTVRYLFYI